MTRRNLQIATALLALVPTLTGLIGLTGIYDPLYASAQLPRNAMLDSNLRFYSGAWLGLGLAAFWLLPRIEQETGLYRALWGMIFLGGIGRLLSLLQVGLPFPPFLAFTVLEVVGAPLFVWWQRRLVQACKENCKDRTNP
jgi:hypothetical protein